MADTATQEQGVVVNEQGETVGTHNPRNDVMNQIAEKAAMQHEADMKSAEESIYQEGQEETLEPPAEIEQEEETVTIKVDGEERQVPKHLIEEAGIRALQKESAADKRLEEATRLYNEAKEVQKNLQLPKGVAQPEQPSEQDVATQLAQAIRYGTDDDANEAIKRIQELNKANPEQLAAYVEDRISHRNAVDQFRTEYKDIADDPYLKQIVIQGYNLFRQNGDQRPHAELYKAIGEELRAWRGNLAAPTSMEEKREKKSSVTSIPVASARRAAPEQPKAETPADIIDGIRRARHQI